MKALLLLALSLFLTSTSQGQLTLVGLENTGVFGQSSSRLALGASVPFHLGTASVSGGLRYRNLSFDHPGLPGLPAVTEYHEFGTEWVVTYPVRETWEMLFLANVHSASNSDFRAQESLGVRGAALLDMGTISVGLAYRNRLDQQLVPLLGIRKETRRLVVDALLPVQAAIWSSPKPRFQAGMEVRYSTFSFRITDHELDRLDHTVITAGPLLRWRLFGGVAVQTGLALAIKHDLEYGSGEQERTEPLASGLQVSARLVYLN